MGEDFVGIFALLVCLKIPNGFFSGRVYSFAPRCADINVLSLSLNKERTKESQPGRSLRDLPGIAVLQSTSRDRHIIFLCGAPSLAYTNGRRGKQNLLPNRTHLGRALMRPRWRELASATVPTALKKPSGGGVPRGVPLVSFLATSWEMPRSSISRTARRVVSRPGIENCAKFHPAFTIFI